MSCLTIVKLRTLKNGQSIFKCGFLLLKQIDVEWDDNWQLDDMEKKCALCQVHVDFGLRLKNQLKSHHDK